MRCTRQAFIYRSRWYSLLAPKIETSTRERNGSAYRFRAPGHPSSCQTVPCEVTGKLTFFDRFATATATFASHAGFFAFCVLLVAPWVPSCLALPTGRTRVFKRLEFPSCPNRTSRVAAHPFR